MIKQYKGIPANLHSQFAGEIVEVLQWEYAQQQDTYLQHTDNRLPINLEVCHLRCVKSII